MKLTQEQALRLYAATMAMIDVVRAAVDALAGACRAAAAALARLRPVVAAIRARRAAAGGPWMVVAG